MIDGLELIEERERRVEEAARTIVATCRGDEFGRGWRPKGVDEVAILLESLGYSADVVSELWYASLFEFAADVAHLIDRFVDDEERAERSDTGWFTRACRDYAVGALYSAPWIVAVLGLAACGAALWSSLSTPTHLATAIALGVYGALVVSGVFSQAIARRLTFYFLQNNARLMLWTLDRFIAAAIATFGLAAVLVWALLRGPYGDTDAGVAAAFFAGSGIFQTSLAPLYVLRRFVELGLWSVLATALTGVTFIVLFHRVVAVPWEPTVLACEVGAVGLTLMVLTIVRMRRVARRSDAAELVPPSARAVGRAAIPYAAFGAAYFVMIVADHIAAGLAGGVPFAYRAGYELGCDVGLLAVIPVIGVTNAALESLPRRILRGGELRLGGLASFDRSMLRFYAVSALAVLAAALAAVALSETFGEALLRSPVLGLAAGQREEASTALAVAAVGYGLLMAGLLNCQFLFFLSRPAPALTAALCGAAVNLTGSAVAVAAGAPAAWCAYALLGGIAVFVAVTTVAVVPLMRRFTYAYYAAY